MDMIIRPTTRGDTLVYFAKLLVAKMNLLAAKSNKINPSMKLVIKAKILFLLHNNMLCGFLVKKFV